MTDGDLLQQMLARLGKEPRAVKFDDHDDLVELDLAGLGLEKVPEEVFAFVNLQMLRLDRTRLTSLPPELGHLTNLQEFRLFSGNRLTALERWPTMPTPPNKRAALSHTLALLRQT